VAVPFPTPLWESGGHAGGDCKNRWMIESLLPQLQAYCRQAFDQAGDIENLQPLSDGWESELWSFRFAGRDIVLRMLVGEQSREKSELESSVLEGLSRTEYPVPTVYATEPDTSVLGQPFMLMERLEGSVLGETLRTKPGSAPGLLERFIKLFVELHDPGLIERAGIGLVATSVEMAMSQAENAINDLDIDEFSPVVEWLKARMDGISLLPLSLTHNDYHPHNVLLRTDGGLVVIDWTSAQLTDLRFDLGWAVMLANANVGTQARRLLLGGYESLRGSRIRDMEFFEAWANARRLVDIVVSIRDGAERLGMRPAAVERMRERQAHIRPAQRLEQLTGIRIDSVEAL
jgi:aminoglycoside phosphotransferase (APT) family kinase protein